jgi:hypothetical protein
VEHRRFDLDVAPLREVAAQCRNYLAAAEQGVAALRVHDQVDIALAIAQLDID